MLMKITTSRVLAGLLSVLLVACDEVTSSTPGIPVQLTIGPAADTLLSGTILSVTGRGIEKDLVFTLTKPDTVTTTSSVSIPAGPARFFTVKGFTGHVQTHQDTLTSDVTNLGLTLRFNLEKFTGTGTIESSVQEYNVAVDDSTGFREEVSTQTAAAGSTLNYTVRVTHRNASAEAGGHAKGDPVADAAVSWASTNPGVATVTSSNCTTAANGTCSISATVNSSATAGQTAGIVATHKGVAHRVTVTVS
jgi:hypothetical protein